MNWTQEFWLLEQYEREKKAAAIHEHTQREAMAKVYFNKMMDCYAAIRRLGYDVNAEVLDNEWDEYVIKEARSFSLAEKD